METRMEPVHIVGAGLAGSEAAWQIARRGVPVVLHEMRPQVGTFALIYPPLHATFGVDAAQIVGFVIAQGLATTINFVIQRTLIFRS